MCAGRDRSFPGEPAVCGGSIEAPLATEVDEQRLRDGKVYAGGARVTTADVLASNSVIHVINTVLILRQRAPEEVRLSEGGCRPPSFRRVDRACVRTAPPDGEVQESTAAAGCLSLVFPESAPKLLEVCDGCTVEES